MKKFLWVVLALLLFSGIVGKENPKEPPKEEPKENAEFMVDSSGNMVFLYGKSIPQAFGSPQFPITVSLAPGESVREVVLGDKDYWAGHVISSGPEGYANQHVIIKPTHLALATNLIITTDKRIYAIKLASLKVEWSPPIKFKYEENISSPIYESPAASAQPPVPANEEKEPIDTGMHFENLNFSYKHAGDFPWAPLRVFDDGKKSYIQMPKALATVDAPVLMLRDSGEDLVVNYRLVTKGEAPHRQTYYVIDRLFQKAFLVKGVGLAQQKVEIWRE